MDAEPLSAGTYAPFLCAWSSRGLVAFKPDRRGFVDPAHPIVVSIDSVPVERWIEAAQRTIPEGSASMRRERAARALRYVGYLRRELGLPARPAIELELAPAGGGESARVSLVLASECPRFGVWPPDGQFLTATDLVYLRIPEMTDDAAGKAREWALKARGRRGLILDVRGNGGGSRAVARALIPLLMRPGSEPRVCNAAAPRLGPDQSQVRDLSDRWLYPAAWPDWTSAERAAIERFTAGVHPEPPPDSGVFGAWHYFVLSPAAEGEPLPPAVVLMDAGCFSATDVFLAAAKGLPGVTLMGTPSSGGSGAARSIKLGQSGIRLRLSSMASYQPDGRLFDGHGVEPDVVVEPEPEDFLGAGDAAMFAARDRLLGR
jgi:hypothetical protein